MVNNCDICGFNYRPNDHYCGGCNVDLREPKGSENLYVDKVSAQTDKNKAKISSKNFWSMQESHTPNGCGLSSAAGEDWHPGITEGWTRENIHPPCFSENYFRAMRTCRKFCFYSTRFGAMSIGSTGS